MSCRPLITVAVRLGLVTLPAVTLNAAYHADVAPPAGTPLLLLAWRAVLASRVCVLLVPALSRRTSLIPQARQTLRNASSLAAKVRRRACCLDFCATGHTAMPHGQLLCSPCSRLGLDSFRPGPRAASTRAMKHTFAMKRTSACRWGCP